jgi:hypothetical protein
LLERHTPGVPIKEEFQQLISEGVQTVGLETMEGIKAGSMRESFGKRRRTPGIAIIEGRPSFSLSLISYNSFNS